MDVRLNSILDYAVRHCRFYEHLGDKILELEMFPLMTKADFRSAVAEILSCEATERNMILKALTDGTSKEWQLSDIERPLDNTLVVERTSGTSGIPTKIVKTRAERLALSLGIWACRRAYDPPVKPNEFAAFYPRSACQGFPFDPRSTSPHEILALYQWLQTQHIRWIQSPPSLLVMHAKALNALGARAPSKYLKFVEIAGAHLGEDDCSAIEGALGARVINQYGTREHWAVGYAERTGAFAINDSCVHVELMDDDDNPITASDKEGTLAATSLILKLLPIVRYKTGDRGKWLVMDDGRRRLVLAPDRDINLMTFKGMRISGIDFFRTALFTVYSSIGFTEVRYIQIRKVDAHRLLLIISREPTVPKIHSALLAYCREYDRLTTIDLKVVADSEIRTLLLGKQQLFINDYDTGTKNVIGRAEQ